MINLTLSKRLEGKVTQGQFTYEFCIKGSDKEETKILYFELARDLGMNGVSTQEVNGYDEVEGIKIIARDFRASEALRDIVQKGEEKPNLRTLEGITVYARNFLRNEYDMELNIPIGINPRLKRSLGRFTNTTSGKAVDIEIAGKTIKYGCDEVLEMTIKHELIHYALFEKGEVFQDGTANFEGQLKAKGAHREIHRSYVGPQYTIKCKGCGKEWDRTVKTVSGYISNCCDDKLELVATKIYDGQKLAEVIRA